MGEATTMVCQLILLSISMNGCLSFAADSKLKGILADAILSRDSPRNVDTISTSNGWRADPKVKLPKRESIGTQEHGLDKLMTDIESALQYLEDESEQNSEFFDKRLRRPSSGRRQHNFIRIGKRMIALRGPKDIQTRSRSSELRNKHISNREIVLPEDLSASNGNRGEGLYIQNAKTEYAESPLDASMEHSNGNYFTNVHNEAHDGQEKLIYENLSKRRINGFVRFGRMSRFDSSSSNSPLSLTTAGMQYISPTPKRAFHKFIRIGRSTRPIQRQQSENMSLRSQEVLNAALSSTSPLNTAEVKMKKTYSQEDNPSLEKTKIPSYQTNDLQKL